MGNDLSLFVDHNVLGDGEPDQQRRRLLEVDAKGDTSEASLATEQGLPEGPKTIIEAVRAREKREKPLFAQLQDHADLREGRDKRRLRNLQASTATTSGVTEVEVGATYLSGLP